MNITAITIIHEYSNILISILLYSRIRYILNLVLLSSLRLLIIVLPKYFLLNKVFQTIKTRNLNNIDLLIYINLL